MLEKLKNNSILHIIIEVVILVLLIVLGLIFINKKTKSYYENRDLLYKRIIGKNESISFKGESTNNYLIFNNLLWRIIRVNKTGTIVLVLDKTINYLPVDNVNSYLNNDFLNELDKSKLVKNNLCSDTITDLNNVTCNNTTDEYVSILDISSYINTIDNTSFINDTIWLLNKYDDNKYYFISNGKISYDNEDNFYGIRPVITLDNDILYESGKGTKEEPFIIKSNDITIGSKIIMDKDEYVVISTKDNLKLALNNTLNKEIKYDEVNNYLNNEYLNGLSYKDKLLDNECNEILFGKEIKDNKTNSKVCLINAYDSKLGDYSNYHINSKVNSYNLVFDSVIKYGTKDKNHNIVPTIKISKDTKLSKDGEKYVLEG